MIEVLDLKKTYRGQNGDVEALAGVTLHVPTGSIYGVVGQSGAGKSTLIRCLNLLERPDAGTIRVDGTDLQALSPAQLRDQRRKIGMIFQHFNLFSSRTVLGNVAFPLECAGVPGRQARQRALELLDLVGLGDKAAAYPAQLSGGQKQRVGIARALANQPTVLLCDEATSALDPATTTSILELLRSLSRRMGLTIVLITHEMSVVKAICDHVALLENGLVVEEGQILDLAARADSRLAAQLFHGRTPGTAEPGAASPAAAASPVPAAPAAPQPAGPHPTGPATRRAAIVFLGAAAGEPLLTRTARHYDVDFNILEGGIERVGEGIVGRLVIEAVGDSPRLDQALEALQQAGCRVEVLDVA
ncbi:MAG: methionine ABC transporter ATP-binding protein [Symbiobacteriia bacterium]